MGSAIETKQTKTVGDPAKIAALEASMKRQQFQPDGLIEILHDAQDIFGYLDKETLLYIAHRLKVPPSRVYGVATFYHLFSLSPPARHKCVVCLGTACFVNGGSALMDSVIKSAGLPAGGTSADGTLSLGSERCIGACSEAPAVVLDGVVYGHETPDRVDKRLKELLKHGPQ